MKKLFLFQQKVQPILKDSENPYYHSNYFDINGLLETIKPIMNELGLLVLQPLVTQDGKSAIKTMIIDSEEGKVLVESVINLPELQDPQKIGSCISYFRRYALQSLLCLSAMDDDGEQVVRTYCQRCQKQGKQTVITDTELQSSAISGYKLCKSCFDIWYSTQNKNK